MIKIPIPNWFITPNYHLFFVWWDLLFFLINYNWINQVQIINAWTIITMQVLKYRCTQVILRTQCTKNLIFIEYIVYASSIQIYMHIFKYLSSQIACHLIDSVSNIYYIYTCSYNALNILFLDYKKKFTIFFFASNIIKWQSKLIGARFAV